MIPNELKAYPQWIGTTEDKVPLHPNGSNALLDDPLTYSTYKEIVEAGFPHIGFVFTKNDPFVGIDLDDHEDKPATEEQKQRFKRIVASANSYTEISLSGRGVHIIVRAKKAINFAQDNVEMRSHNRYLLLTGNCIADRTKIKYRQHFINMLCSEVKQHRKARQIASQPEKESDEQLLRKARNAFDSNKFDVLWTGNWEVYYPSQSEADLALCSILGFYSKNDEQVIRLFRMSALGKRDKANRQSYIDYTINRMRSTEIPLINIYKFRNKFEKETFEKKQLKSRRF
jgi:primase-polymerase (primpol)-like protein